LTTPLPAFPAPDAWVARRIEPIEPPDSPDAHRPAYHLAGEVTDLVRIPGGFSYETWRLRARWTDGGERRDEPLIMRRAPRGGVPEPYDASKEVRVLRGLQPTPVPALGPAHTRQSPPAAAAEDGVVVGAVEAGGRHGRRLGRARRRRGIRPERDLDHVEEAVLIRVEPGRQGVHRARRQHHQPPQCRSREPAAASRRPHPMVSFEPGAMRRGPVPLLAPVFGTRPTTNGIGCLYIGTHVTTPESSHPTATHSRASGTTCTRTPLPHTVTPSTRKRNGEMATVHYVDALSLGLCAA